ncbi:hypothetical protein FisN_16Hh293 [Fistulifera solaris]|uniref:Uncharacterized protein n=1 Tax=Fistulifera solaris TaxID=1519565 RepID=A0A1Z5KSW4_FISSO|nr:hypothetical protein FisN_16Hh293 [Fistulifera solaris]|eukprot:GAX29277.1 hypothetical protein FisN_16Hh293 [Fistulifera solaris]
MYSLRLSPIPLSCLFLMIHWLPAQAFLSPASPRTHITQLQSGMDPELITAGMPVIQMGVVAAASAVAGAFSQQPRIQELEKALLESQIALNETRLETEQKMTQLEDKLFEMDQEYEAQTTRFKKRYDNQMREELEKAKDKIRTDYNFRLAVQTDKLKSEKLMDGLGIVAQSTDKEAQLSQVRIEKAQLAELNRRLEEALQKSNQELENMKAEASKKTFFGLF